jgi:hypothetical protein
MMCTLCLPATLLRPKPNEIMFSVLKTVLSVLRTGLSVLRKGILYCENDLLYWEKDLLYWEKDFQYWEMYFRSCEKDFLYWEKYLLYYTKYSSCHGACFARSAPTGKCVSKESNDFSQANEVWQMWKSAPPAEKGAFLGSEIWAENTSRLGSIIRPTSFFSLKFTRCISYV